MHSRSVFYVWLGTVTLIMYVRVYAVQVRNFASLPFLQSIVPLLFPFLAVQLSHSK